MRHVTRTFVLATFVLLGLLVSHGSAHAASAVGTWQSDSGWVFVIPDSKTDFDLIAKKPDGSKELWKAHWVDGMVGTQFQFGQCVVTFNSKDTDRARVVCGDEVNHWVRVNQKQRLDSIVGNWKSSSGFRFAIPATSSDEFQIIMTDPKGVKTLVDARWVEGMRGTQFTWASYTCTRKADDPDTIRLVGDDGVYVWKRMK
ncbi:MAG TPA: hypothetical protein VFQ53_02875 [Kofleriaceae bacterium]|nr:hypothetical protein [Kofleriaceae bacterium]